MPPKKAAPSTKPPTKKAGSKPIKDESNSAKPTETKPPPQSKKRKSPSSTTTPAPPPKSSRRSTRTTARTPAPPAQTLNYLLSPSCLSLVRPKDETALPSNTELKRTYTTTVPLTPFEELLSAVILSRPISHALGQRAIRTVLNPPYELRTPEAIRKAGREKVHDALEVARTQHKAKTADSVFGLAGVVLEKFGGVGLDGLRYEDGKGKERGRDGVRDTLVKAIKGTGKTGADIFLRRVQGYWGECWPFLDGKSGGALEGLGLPGMADGLRGAIEEAWGKLDVSGVAGKGAEEKKRMALVLVVERAVQGQLEGKTGEMLEAISGDSKEEK